MVLAENMRKILGAVWELPVNNTANPAHFHLHWAELVVLFTQQATPKRLLIFLTATIESGSITLINGGQGGQGTHIRIIAVFL